MSAWLATCIPALTRLVWHLAVWACPMCGKSMVADGRAGLLEGFAWSWLLIASVPILMASAFATVLFRTVRKAQRAAAAAATPIVPKPAAPSESSPLPPDAAAGDAGLITAK